MKRKEKTLKFLWKLWLKLWWLHHFSKHLNYWQLILCPSLSIKALPTSKFIMFQGKTLQGIIVFCENSYTGWVCYIPVGFCLLSLPHFLWIRGRYGQTPFCYRFSRVILDISSDIFSVDFHSVSVHYGELVVSSEVVSSTLLSPFL